MSRVKGERRGWQINFRGMDGGVVGGWRAML